MITKISRIVLIITVIFVLSYVFPEYYWMTFEKHHPTPNIIYSALLNDFVQTVKRDNKIYRLDNRGNHVSKKEFEKLAPLFFYRSLYYYEAMPDSLNGVALSYKKIKRNAIFSQIKPSVIQTPVIKLSPLLESVPDGPRLSMPDDFFRITERMEFIDCETNEIIPELTESFTKALKAENFSFPAKNFWGNPNIMKPFDEGYFVLDSNNKLFHVKRVHNKPFVRNVPLPDGIVPVFINVTEMELREFYAIMITEKSEIYLISYNNYKLIKIPLENYDYRTMKFKLQGTLLYRAFTITSDTSIAVFVTDRKYNLINKYFQSWPDKYESAAGKIFEAIVPFSIELTSPHTNYVDFYIHFSNIFALTGIIFSLLFYIIYQKKKGDEASQCKLDYLIVLLTGIYGLTAVILIRDETWKV